MRPPRRYKNDFLSTAEQPNRAGDVGGVMHVDVDLGVSVAAYTRLSQNSSPNTRVTPPFLVTPFRVALSYHLSRRTGITQYRKHRDKPTTCAPVDCKGGTRGMYTSIKCGPRRYRPRVRIIVAVNYDLNSKTDTKPPNDRSPFGVAPPLSSRTLRSKKKTDVCFRIDLSCQDTCILIERSNVSDRAINNLLLGGSLNPI